MDTTTRATVYLDGALHKARSAVRATDRTVQAHPYSAMGVAAAVGLNILVTGYRLVSDSVTSLLDAALPEEDMTRLRAVLDGLSTPEVQFHDIRTLECIIALDPDQAPLRIGQRVRVALSNP